MSRQRRHPGPASGGVSFAGEEAREESAGLQRGEGLLKDRYRGSGLPEARSSLRAGDCCWRPGEHATHSAAKSVAASYSWAGA